MLAFYNFSILQKEDILKNGKLIFLSLKSDNNRSIMQGDFMQLKYDLVKVQIPDSLTKRGFVVVELDTQSVAHLIRLQDHSSPLKSNEHLIEYTRTRLALHIGAETYFFQEGKTLKFKAAKYSGLLVDEKGNTILKGLYDANFQKIE
jgi:uncharacterized membrane-anchored protein